MESESGDRVEGPMWCGKFFTIGTGGSAGVEENRVRGTGMHALTAYVSVAQLFAQTEYRPPLSFGTIVILLFIPAAVVVAAVVYGYLRQRSVDKRQQEVLGDMLEEMDRRRTAAGEGFVVVEQSEICPRCGGDIDPGTRSCAYCGAAYPFADTRGAAKTVGIVRHDVIIDDQLAFRAREMVQIESVSPDPSKPDCKYVVFSSSMNRRFFLSDEDLFT